MKRPPAYDVGIFPASRRAAQSRATVTHIEGLLAVICLLSTLALVLAKL